MSSGVMRSDLLHFVYTIITHLHLRMQQHTVVSKIMTNQAGMNRRDFNEAINRTSYLNEIAPGVNVKQVGVVAPIDPVFVL